MVVGQGSADRWNGSRGAGDCEGVCDALRGVRDDLRLGVNADAGGSSAGTRDRERDEVESKLKTVMH